MKPSKLDLDPNSQTAAKEWNHWKRTFDNFIIECGDTAPNKFRSVINFISHNVFDYVEDCTTFDTIITILEALYVKTPNVIFARHQLAMRQQQSGESLDEFLQNLHKLSKNCNFADVSVIDYRTEMVRDSFISRLSSNYIRQRLLENTTLTLDAAYAQARSLDTAQKNPEVYTKNSQISSHVAATGELDSGNTTAASILPKSKRKCFFCGGPYVVGHRNSCPAVDAVCNNCHKEGQFAKVCQSKQRDKNVGGAAALFTPILSIIFEEASPPISAACPTSLLHASVTVTLNGENLTALLDSCSSDSFINEKTAKHLDLKILFPNGKFVHRFRCLPTPSY